MHNKNIITTVPPMRALRKMATVENHDNGERAIETHLSHLARAAYIQLWLILIARRKTLH